MASFAEQVKIHLTHGRQVSIRVVLHHRGAVLLGDAQAVVGNRISLVGFHSGDHGDIDAVEFRFGLGLAVGCVASTTDTAPLLRDLARAGLRFQHVFTSEALGAYKPSPAFYQPILRALALSPKETVFVGDSLKDDVIGPKKVGIRTVWVNRKSLLVGDVFPDAIVSSLEGLPGVLEAWKET